MEELTMNISRNEEAVNILNTRKAELAEAIMQSSVKDDSIRNYTPYQKQKCLQDINYNLQYLSEALLLKSDSLWEDYIRWLKFLLLSLGLNKYGLAGHFSVMGEVLQQYVPQRRPRRSVLSPPKPAILCSPTSFSRLRL